MAKGLDCGTSYYIASTEDSIKKQRNAFLTVDGDIATVKRMLKRQKIPYVEKAGKIHIIGQHAFNYAQIFSKAELKRPMKSHWHSDFDNLKLTSKSKTAIYYVNTNNGYTVFKNKKIKSEANKMVIFNGNTQHKVKYQTDRDTRIVINFLYESI